MAPAIVAPPRSLSSPFLSRCPFDVHASARPTAPCAWSSAQHLLPSPCSSMERPSSCPSLYSCTKTSEEEELDRKLGEMKGRGEGDLEGGTESPRSSRSGGTVRDICQNRDRTFSDSLNACEAAKEVLTEFKTMPVRQGVPGYPRVLLVSRRQVRKGKYINFMGEYHLDLIQKFGGAPVIVPRTRQTIECLEMYMPMDGFMITEGEDLGAELEPYGPSSPSEASLGSSEEEEEEVVDGESKHNDPEHRRRVHSRHPASIDVDSSKDKIEWELLKQCSKLGVPFLGICRGAQMLNVVNGGSLLFDIELDVPNAIAHISYDNYDLFRHDVCVIPRTPLDHWFREQQEQSKFCPVCGPLPTCQYSSSSSSSSSSPSSSPCSSPCSSPSCSPCAALSSSSTFSSSALSSSFTCSSLPPPLPLPLPLPLCSSPTVSCVQQHDQVNQQEKREQMSGTEGERQGATHGEIGVRPRSPRRRASCSQGHHFNISVNSYHHQGVRRLARNLRPMAHSPDGLVEAFYEPTSYEPKQGRFCVGLQFHPERMMHDYPGCVRVYSDFMEACWNYRAKRLGLSTTDD